MKEPLPMLIMAALLIAPTARALAQLAESESAMPNAAGDTASGALHDDTRKRRRRSPAHVTELEPAVNVSEWPAATASDPQDNGSRSELPRPIAPRLPSATALRPAASAPGSAADAVSNARDASGQELPKVLYIVPWKKSDPGDLIGRPANTLLDEVLSPLDPEVFERHRDYYETLYGDRQQE